MSKSASGIEKSQVPVSRREIKAKGSSCRREICLVIS